VLSLFVAFAEMSLGGFGWVLSFARRSIVYGELAALRRSLSGCPAPPIGLLIAIVVRMMKPLLNSRASIPRITLWPLLAGGALGFAGVV
jgi:hypothetical protein